MGTAVGRRGESGAAQLAAASRELRSGRFDQADPSGWVHCPPEGRVRGEVAGGGRCGHGVLTRIRQQGNTLVRCVALLFVRSDYLKEWWRRECVSYRRPWVLQHTHPSIRHTMWPKGDA